MEINIGNFYKIDKSDYLCVDSAFHAYHNNGGFGETDYKFLKLGKDYNIEDLEKITLHIPKFEDRKAFLCVTVKDCENIEDQINIKQIKRKAIVITKAVVTQYKFYKKEKSHENNNG